ncbi:MAG: hypothetical protein AB1813_18440 [Verrucomicrobiota bacterium]|jgi:signal transduction histidine kinase
MLDAFNTRRSEGFAILLLIAGATAMMAIVWQSHVLGKAVKTEIRSAELLSEQIAELKDLRQRDVNQSESGAAP